MIHTSLINILINVGQFLEQNKRQTWSLSSNNTVKQAIQLMAERNIGCVLVNDGDKLLGVFTERDYARKVILMGKHSHDTQLHEVMSRELVTVSPEFKMADCMKLMTEKKVRHLPVQDNGKNVGVISIGDVVNLMIDEQKYLIEQLQKYIVN